MFEDILQKHQDKFDQLYNMLVEENKIHNLTAITERADVFEKHFADSLAALPLIHENASVVDIGTGAGFPALPLAIAKPSLALTAIDSVGKKVAFVNKAAAALSLNVQALHTRIEDYGQGQGREQFCYAVSRAVANLSTLAEYALPLVRVGGKFIAYKLQSEDISLANAAISVLGGGRVEVLAQGNGRCLVVIHKEFATPARYPRSQNKPRTSPIGVKTWKQF